MRILIIEDDRIFGRGLRDYLSSDGHVVDWYQTLSQVSTINHAEPYDVWLVDWNLPDGSGLEWLKSQRRRAPDTHIIMITARDQLIERVHGFDGGADDYLVKPFALEELSARLRANLRRKSGGAHEIESAHIRINLASKQLLVHNQPITLTAREWVILESLALRPNRLVSRDELEVLALGAYSDCQSNALEVHISHLRQKIGKETIENVRGMGYRLILPKHPRYD